MFTRALRAVVSTGGGRIQRLATQSYGDGFAHNIKLAAHNSSHHSGSLESVGGPVKNRRTTKERAQNSFAPLCGGKCCLEGQICMISFPKLNLRSRCMNVDLWEIGLADSPDAVFGAV